MAKSKKRAVQINKKPVSNASTKTPRTGIKK